ncbi:FxsA family protein [Helicobacter sp. 14348-15]|uniref:FxsA family protein n=1 Tax=Helicobacter TaxID=209 RepID=UPI00202B1B10|nr:MULTISPECIES: FxsA family protein [Helicobacter]MCL9820728.1 FxsA family protein [Helicobacter colisuis]MDY5615696.1 FxsA family protein [Helicobacter sp.]
MRLILLVMYLIIEVFVSYEVIDIIGVLGFVLEILVSAFLGFGILLNFRLFFGEALGKLRSREMTYEAFVGSNIFRILGAILLILPGAFTDILGLLMQFSVFGLMLVKPFVKVDSGKQHSDIIDVEVIEKEIKD